MSGFWKDTVSKIDNNINYSCIVVLVAEVLSLVYSLPLAWMCYLIAGLLFWKVELNNIVKLLALFLFAPIVFMAFIDSPLTINFVLAMILQGLMIYLLRKSESWSFAIEITSIILLVMNVVLGLLFPGITEPFVEYIASVNAIDPSEVNIPPGFLLLAVATESLLFVWLSSRLRLHANHVPKKVIDSVNYIRMGYGVLIASLLTLAFVYATGNDIKPYLYIMAFPYVTSGVSLLSWLTSNYKKKPQKNTNNGYMRLIFIFLYATLLPLVLGFFGLIDVGLNLRKKYQNYLDRR